MRPMLHATKCIPKLIVLLALVFCINSASAAESQSQLFVPLIGVSSVPSPLALPGGKGPVTYKYAVKNFLREVDLTEVQVADDKCAPVTYVEGDDNSDSQLQYSETWRYQCTTEVSETTLSIATATGTVNNITASHQAYATVVVGSDTLPPLVSVINITKVSYPLSLPAEGGPITFTYRVNNPGVVPLSDVIVTDDKCKAISSKLGDRNGNNLLDVTEVWVYTCTTTLTVTTTNTVNVSASANGLTAVGSATITVQVAGSAPVQSGQPVPAFPITGLNPDFNTTVWSILAGILAALITYYFLVTRKRGTRAT